jgi:hypothetical protein
MFFEAAPAVALGFGIGRKPRFNAHFLDELAAKKS